MIYNCFTSDSNHASILGTDDIGIREEDIKQEPPDRDLDKEMSGSHLTGTVELLPIATVN